jgi:hypothetical protein
LTKKIPNKLAHTSFGYAQGRLFGTHVRSPGVTALEKLLSEIESHTKADDAG